RRGRSGSRRTGPSVVSGARGDGRAAGGHPGRHLPGRLARLRGGVVPGDRRPVASCAAIDGDGRRKPLWYALRRVHADRPSRSRTVPWPSSTTAQSRGRVCWGRCGPAGAVVARPVPRHVNE
ncbi:hypothetical protein, partial [Streptosporangium roseum]|uniref:hypothetical protein n=1 Tax=Streptosporangium roseum TaxID=2001 RepID=UPI003330CC1B